MNAWRTFHQPWRFYEWNHLVWGAVKWKFFEKQAPSGGTWESSGWLALGEDSVALFAEREVHKCHLKGLLHAKKKGGR